MFSDLLARDRERSGLTIVQAARRVGVSVRDTGGWRPGRPGLVGRATTGSPRSSRGRGPSARYARTVTSRVPPALLRDLLRYLAATSKERARLIGELVERNPEMADMLMQLEADDALRARFEIDLLHLEHGS